MTTEPTRKRGAGQLCWHGYLMLLLPDPFYRMDQLSGAAFLWFGQVSATLAPPVVTAESFQVLERVKREQPPWGGALDLIGSGWRALHDGQKSSLESLDNLRDRIKVLWLSYDGGSEALLRSRALITSTGLADEDVRNLIDVSAACGELTRHLFLERWLEGDQDPESMWRALSETLDPDAFEQRLVEAYFLRFAAFEVIPQNFALTNPRLLDFLWRCWSAAGSPEGTPEERSTDRDAIGYEIFRHLVSPRLDPLDEPESALNTSLLLATKPDEIEALRRQCLRLAEKIPDLPLDRLNEEVASFINIHVRDELGGILNMSERRVQEYLASVASVRVAWASLLSGIAGATQQSSGFTVAGVLGLAATVLSKGVSTTWDAHKELRDSPYRLFRSLPR